MPSKLVKIAHKIAVGHRPLFDTLLELEKTKSIRSKVRLNFTIDKTVARDFKTFCRSRGYNMSAKMERAIKEMIKSVK